MRASRRRSNGQQFQMFLWDPSVTFLRFVWYCPLHCFIWRRWSFRVLTGCGCIGRYFLWLYLVVGVFWSIVFGGKNWLHSDNFILSSYIWYFFDYQLMYILLQFIAKERKIILLSICEKYVKIYIHVIISSGIHDYLTWHDNNCGADKFISK